MIFEIYHNESDSNIRVTLFDIEIYNRIEGRIIIPTIVVRPALGNFLTYFHKRCNDKEFNKESFVKDSDYMNMIYCEMFPLFERKASFAEILDKLERIMPRKGKNKVNVMIYLKKPGEGQITLVLNFLGTKYHILGLAIRKQGK